MSSAKELFAPWVVAGEEPVLVRQSSNDVFRGSRSGETVYLRVTPGRHRTVEEVEAELGWMEALASAGLRVVRPIRSASGRLVEPLRTDGGTACLACFQAAPGRLARKPDDFRPAVIASWAALLVDLHQQVRAQPGAGSGRRSWDRDQVFETALQASDPATAREQAALREIVAWLHGLDRGRESFGLTHADLHLGNLNVDGDGETVTAFDFDDACHHWFLHDVAVAVTSIRKAAWEHPGSFDAAAAEAQFLSHYFPRGPLGPRWRARLEAFVAYRIALSACWASRAAETGELDEDMRAWFRRSLPWWSNQLADRRPLVQQAMEAWSD